MAGLLPTRWLKVINARCPNNKAFSICKWSKNNESVKLSIIGNTSTYSNVAVTPSILEIVYNKTLRYTALGTPSKFYIYDDGEYIHLLYKGALYLMDLIILFNSIGVTYTEMEVDLPNGAKLITSIS